MANLTTNRFGSRYGRRLKEIYSKIEAQQRSKHKCPYCNKAAVRRKAVGIWECSKCGVKFASKAYTI